MSKIYYLKIINILICILLISGGLFSVYDLFTENKPIMLIIGLILILYGIFSMIFLKLQDKNILKNKKNVAVSFFAIILGLFLSKELNENINYNSFYFGIYLVLFSILNLDYKSFNVKTNTLTENILTLFLIFQFIIGSILALMVEELSINIDLIFAISFFINAFVLYKINIVEVNQSTLKLKKINNYGL